MGEQRTSLYIGSTLEASHEAARRAYPLSEEGPSYDVMLQRAHMINYGPLAIYAAERALREAALVHEPGAVEAHATDGLIQLSQFLANQGEQ